MDSIIILTCLFGTYLCGYMYQRASFKQRAITAGVAKYVINPMTGKKRFVFIPNHTIDMCNQLELFSRGSILKARVDRMVEFWRNEYNSAND